MCKARYMRIVEEEVNGKGYEKVTDSSFEEIQGAIVERKIDSLDTEHLPAPKASFRGTGKPISNPLVIPWLSYIGPHRRSEEPEPALARPQKEQARLSILI